MYKLLTLLVLFTISAHSVEFVQVSENSLKYNPPNTQLIYKRLLECEELKKDYPDLYKNLDNVYIIVEMSFNDTTRQGNMLCGRAIRETNTIVIYPAGHTNRGCYNKDVNATIFHEILHLIGLPNHIYDKYGYINYETDPIEYLTNKCFIKYTVN